MHMQETLEELLKRYDDLCHQHLNIDISRGKPNKKHLDLSNELLDVVNSGSDFIDTSNNDVRNYGELTGLKECRELFASLLDVDNDNIIVYGNSSLNIQYQLIADAFIKGINGNIPWSKLEKIKWLCPVPGYDRHFSISEYFGMEMINIPMDENGPDMDLVEKYIKDPSVKGIWCVPIYSNPTGITYSDKVVTRFAKLKPAAPDFRIFWDLAYLVHHLYNGHNDKLLNVLKEAKKYGNEDMIYMFSSFSKITFAGSSISALAASNKNIKEVSNNLKYQIIGYDKLNQLRHVRYFKDVNDINEHMKKHADIVRDKFNLMINALEEIKDISWFTRPNGGYFISLFVKEGTASKVVERCRKCGLTLTDAGCAYPYHNDPYDSHIRIAPTYLDLDELKKAAGILVVSTKIEYLLLK
ncbi:MAG: aminotransferase class I/II-fold pyridoxal phosphate-dependent enzyme [Bacilli bacterium]|nr:aminotransferase class I/II-fold pyridoxal phosphate-dependent enzyme [Bacilli bacterium]